MQGSKNFHATTLLLKPSGLGNWTELLKNGGTILAFVALWKVSTELSQNSSKLENVALLVSGGLFSDAFINASYI